MSKINQTININTPPSDPNKGNNKETDKTKTYLGMFLQYFVLPGLLLLFGLLLNSHFKKEPESNLCQIKKDILDVTNRIKTVSATQKIDYDDQLKLDALNEQLTLYLSQKNLCEPTSNNQQIIEEIEKSKSILNKY